MSIAVTISLARIHAAVLMRRKQETFYDKCMWSYMHWTEAQYLQKALHSGRHTWRQLEII
jgi:hypothetical protein